jgi:hypothetical protein
MARLELEPANREPVDLELPNLEMPNLEMPKPEMPKLESRGPALFRTPAVSLGVLPESESKAALPAGEPLVKLHPA